MSENPLSPPGPDKLGAKGFEELGKVFNNIVTNLGGHPIFLFGIASMLAAILCLALLLFRSDILGTAPQFGWLPFVLLVFGLLLVGLEVAIALREGQKAPPEQKLPEERGGEELVPVRLEWGEREEEPEEGPALPVDPTALEQNYLGYVAAECDLLPLSVIDPKYVTTSGESKIPLRQVYTPLDVTAHARKEGHPGERAPGKREVEWELLHEGETRRLSALEAVGDPETPWVVLLGDPGSGKSTFVNHLALCLAMARLPSHGDWLRQLPGWPHGSSLLPVRIILRDFAARGLPPRATRGTAQMLWDFLNWELSDGGQSNYFPHLQRELRTRGGLVLLDGLDEVPDAAHQRERVKEAIADFARALKPCRFLVTCRVYAYQDPRWQLDGFRRYTLAPFSEEQIDRFIKQWYQAVATVELWREEKVAERVATLKWATRLPYLRWLAERPLLLTLMATLHTSRGTLPRDRAELYADCVKLLLEHWQRPKRIREDGVERVEGGLLDALGGLPMERLERALSRAAYLGHERQGREPERRADRAADIPEADLLTALRPPRGLPDSEGIDPWKVIHYVRTRAGLLLERGPETYYFPHRTFQEYLAACHLSDADDFPNNIISLARHDPAWWREVFLLAAVRARRGIYGQAVTLLDALLESRNFDPRRPVADADWPAAALAGQAAVEIGLVERAFGSEWFTTVLARIRDWLAALLEAEALSVAERAAAGDALAQLGDPRPGVGTPEPVFVEVPGGKFLMGSTQEAVERWNKEAGGDYYNNELPQHPVHLDTFYMARYPVTNAQYARFVQESGHEPPTHWPSGAPPADEANHPVVYVSRDDAVAYCQWLTQQISKSQNQSINLQIWRNGRVEICRLADLQVRLPTEAEWEKAARGTDGREWPWGSEWDGEKCNWDGNGIYDTTPVGMYPRGRSPYHVLEMAGDVWEWTASLYGKYPYPTDGSREDRHSREPRVLRGGAFDSGRRDVRCAFRFGYGPDARYRHYGFRIVVSPTFPNSEL